MDDLDALERLEAQATPGPWEARRTLPAPHERWNYVAAAGSDICNTAPGGAERAGAKDAALIAAARNALPTLLAELRRLRRVEAAAKAYEAAVIDLERALREWKDGAALNAAYRQADEAKAALWAALETTP